MPPVKKPAEAEDVLDEDPSLQALLTHVGSRIRKLREMQDLSLPALEEFTGIHINELRNIENGKRNLTFKTAHKIARTIGVHTWELVVPHDKSSIRPKRRKSKGG